MKTFHMKLISLSLLSAFGSAYAGVSPFAPAPLNLESPTTVKTLKLTDTYKEIVQQTRESTTTTTYSKGAKPNVMLFLDDSGSMREKVPGTSKNRMGVLRDVMSKIVDENKTKVNFGLTWFNQKRRDVPIAQPANEADDATRERVGNNIIRIIKGTDHYGMTPTLDRYIAAVDNLKDNIKYRCQKNYVILMSDGDSNFGNEIYWSVWNTNKEENVIDFFSKNNRETYPSGVSYANWVKINQLVNENSFWRDALARKYEKLVKSIDGEEYNVMCERFKEPDHHQNPTIQTFCDSIKNSANRYNRKIVYYPYTGVTDPYYYWDMKSYQDPIAFSPYIEGMNHVRQVRQNKKMPSHREQQCRIINNRKRCKWVWVTPLPPYSYAPAYNYNYLQYYAGSMLRHLSAALDESDLKTGGVDAAGVSWDDPAFKNQKITTFTIGFGSGVTAGGQAFLKQGATPNSVKDKDGKVQDGYFVATDEAALLDAMNRVFETISIENTKPEDDQPITDTNSTLDQSTPHTEGQNTEPIVTQEDSYSTTVPATAGSAARENGIPGMAASVYLPSGLRSAQIRFVKLNEYGKVETDGSGKPLFTTPSFGNRKALINTGTVVDWTGPSVTGVSNGYFDLPDSAIIVDASGNSVSKDLSHEWHRTLLPWVTRTGKQPGVNDSDAAIVTTAQDSDYTVNYRNRPADEHDMGDVVDTPVLVFGPTSEQNPNAPTQPVKKVNEKYLVTAANDGMVYIFERSDNADHPYDLKLNYLPASMPREDDDTVAKNYKDIAEEAYGQDIQHPHIFLINGGIVWRKTDSENLPGSGHYFVVGNMGQGARGMYALSVGGQDVVGQDIGINAVQGTWARTVPLFEVDAKTQPGIGYTIGSPAIGRISTNYTHQKLTHGIERDVVYAAFMGSGFRGKTDSKKPDYDQETALYIYNTLGKDVGTNPVSSSRTNGRTGQLLAKVLAGDTGGLASPTLLDVNYDGIADYAFAGDYSGNMWRFDLRDYPNIRATKIFEGDKDRPITAAPAIVREEKPSLSKFGGRFVIAFGTGSEIYSEDSQKTDQQAIYGIYQRFNHNLNPVDLNDPQKPEGTHFRKTAKEGSLKEQTFTIETLDKGTFRTVSNEPIKDDEGKLTHQGWKIGLDKKDGERIVMKPQVALNTVVFISKTFKINEENQSKDLCKMESGKDPEEWLNTGWKKISEAKRENVKNGPWSSWEEIASSSTSTDDTSTGTEDPCSGKSSTTSKKEQREQINFYDNIARYSCEIPSKVDSGGWVLQLRASNGGELNVGTCSGSGPCAMEDAGIDFTRDLEEKMDEATVAQTHLTELPYQTYKAGMMFSGIPSVSLIEGRDNSGSGSQGDSFTASTSASGDSGGSGDDYKLVDRSAANTDPKTHCKDNPNDPVCRAIEKCFKSDLNIALTSDSKVGVGDAYRLFGEKCGESAVSKPSLTTYRRISWREIF